MFSSHSCVREKSKDAKESSKIRFHNTFCVSGLFTNFRLRECFVCCMFLVPVHEKREARFKTKASVIILANQRRPRNSSTNQTQRRKTKRRESLLCLKHMDTEDNEMQIKHE